MDKKSFFQYRALFPCSAADLYQWHARKGALDRLLPPWEQTFVVSREGGIDPGGRVEMLMHAGPFPFRWVAHHVENMPQRMFRDIQHKGPFSLWSHSHIFEDREQGCCLEDRIEYALPAHSWMPGFLKRHVDKTLLRTFQHRHRVLEADIRLHNHFKTKPMRILISGASGVLGRALLPLLTTGGHEVWTLVRRKAKREDNELYWNPITGEIDQLPRFDAVIHLAGEYIGLGRWTDEKKKMVVESRTKGTTLLAQTLAAQPEPPGVFLSASAVGYYGDTKGEVVDEHSSVGSDFISHVCSVWEEAAQPAAKAGIRTVLMRIGVALTPGGGALQRLMSSARLGFIRSFGDGNQYVSWISIDDTISAIYYAMCCDRLEGPINISAPYPVTNAELMQTLAGVMGRPLLVSIPASLLKIVYGQMASEILLSGCRTSCKKLLDAGFRFRHETLEEALRSMLGRFELVNQAEEEPRT